jgi:hypothetical protein
MDLRFLLIISGIIGSLAILSIIITIDVKLKVKKGIAMLRDLSFDKTPLYSIEHSLASCPKPVKIYLEHALALQNKMIHFASLKQIGEFRTSIDGEWSPMRADGHFLATKPGFIWKSRFGSGFIPTKTAWLELLDGKGFGSVKFLGLFTILNPSGYEADISLLSRYLMESIWFPTALLPSNYLSWKAVDDMNAIATLSYGTQHVSAQFTFNENGDIAYITSHDKYRDFKGSFEKEQFTLHCKNYQIFQQIRIPSEVEFVWNLEKQDFSYGKFKITSIKYEF